MAFLFLSSCQELDLLPEKLITENVSLLSPERSVQKGADVVSFLCIIFVLFFCMPLHLLFFFIIMVKYILHKICHFSNFKYIVQWC